MDTHVAVMVQVKKQNKVTLGLRYMFKTLWKYHGILVVYF